MIFAAMNASFLTGCVGFLPVPPLSSEVHEGRKIESRDVGFIVPGVTTRIEVLRRLGSPTRHCDRPPAIAYLWETSGWKTYWWILTPYGGGDDNISFGGRHALFVAFNDNGIVYQTKFVSLSMRTSLDDELEEWAKRVRAIPHKTR